MPFPQPSSQLSAADVCNLRLAFYAEFAVDEIIVIFGFSFIIDIIALCRLQVSVYCWSMTVRCCCVGI